MEKPVNGQKPAEKQKTVNSTPIAEKIACVTANEAIRNLIRELVRG